MTCSTCSAAVEDALKKHSGVTKVSVALVNNMAEVSHPVVIPFGGGEPLSRNSLLSVEYLLAGDIRVYNHRYCSSLRDSQGAWLHR